MQPRAGAVPVGQVSESTPVSSTPTPTPAPTADPAAAATVCADVIEASGAATIVINNQLSLLEQAAAAGDQAGLVAAAEAINTQFTTLSASFATQAQILTSPQLTKTLTDISAALAEMASPRYNGTMVDIKKKMVDFEAAFEATCAT